MIFPFASCLPTERKMKGQMPSFSLSLAITNMPLLLFFSNIYSFSKELFFSRLSELAKLFCH
jgi:hypothetical protein